MPVAGGRRWPSDRGGGSRRAEEETSLFRCALPELAFQSLCFHQGDLFDSDLFGERNRHLDDPVFEFRLDLVGLGALGNRKAPLESAIGNLRRK